MVDGDHDESRSRSFLQEKTLKIQRQDRKEKTKMGRKKKHEDIISQIYNQITKKNKKIKIKEDIQS